MKALIKGHIGITQQCSDGQREGVGAGWKWAEGRGKEDICNSVNKNKGKETIEESFYQIITKMKKLKTVPDEIILNRLFKP